MSMKTWMVKITLTILRVTMLRSWSLDEEQEVKTKQPENKATKPSRLNTVGIRQRAAIKVNQNCSVNLSCSVPHYISEIQFVQELYMLGLWIGDISKHNVISNELRQ